MNKFTKLSVVTALAAGLMVGLLFKDSLITTSSAQEAKIVRLQATNKSSVIRTVRIVLDEATIDLVVPPKAVLVSQGENVRMLGAVETSYAGQVRISIQENGEESMVLKAEKAAIKYSQAWFPFNKKS